jgi:hypothetical protein
MGTNSGLVMLFIYGLVIFIQRKMHDQMICFRMSFVLRSDIRGQGLHEEPLRLIREEEKPQNANASQEHN